MQYNLLNLMKTNIPFLKLIVDLRGVIIKYLKNQARLQRYTNYSLQTKNGLCLGLMQCYIKIKII